MQFLNQLDVEHHLVVISELNIQLLQYTHEFILYLDVLPSDIHITNVNCLMNHLCSSVLYSDHLHYHSTIVHLILLMPLLNHILQIHESSTLFSVSAGYQL